LTPNSWTINIALPFLELNSDAFCSWPAKKVNLENQNPTFFLKILTDKHIPLLGYKNRWMFW